MTGALESMGLIRLLFLSLCFLQAVAVADLLIFDEPKHLGTSGVPEWREFASKTPLGMNLKHVFEAQAFIGAGTLLIWQDDVKNDGWQVRLNGRGLGRLHSYESKVVHRLAVPSGTNKDGLNTLEILGPKMIDDVVLHRAVLLAGMAADVFGQASLEISVKDDDQLIPCRITIADTDGFLAPLYVAADRNLAIRPGVVYTLSGKVRAGLLPGRYKIYATRGFEYSMASQEVEVKAGSKGKVTLRIKREVPMPGYISCDTHIHVRTFSGHGDSTVEERIPTIAGEHIELAVATDHNVHADYEPFQQQAGADKFFTTVIGNEVTTKVGHFNAFPIKKGSPVVDHRSEDWPTLMSRMRKTPGVQVIQLNHPRNVHSGFSPTSSDHFNFATGQNLRGPEWDFDAFEVITSAALQDDLMRTFGDWFGLLNYGHRITGVASSDTHDVARYILGQGRTYVPCDDSDPSRVPVDQVCKSLREGRALFGMGLLTDMKVGGKFGVGDLAIGQGGKVTVEVEILGPSWVEADTVVLYQNGYQVRQARLSGTLGKAGKKALVKWVIPKPRYDAWLVAVAKGPAVKEPCWEIPRPYQHKGIDWEPSVIGATNPIWIDADGDAKFTSVRHYAKKLVRDVGTNPKKLFEHLVAHDSAMATQVAGILHNLSPPLSPKSLDSLLKKSSSHVRRGFQDFNNAHPERDGL